MIEMNSGLGTPDTPLREKPVLRLPSNRQQLDWWLSLTGRRESRYKDVRLNAVGVS